jgi:hypothetical protein
MDETFFTDPGTTVMENISLFKKEITFIRKSIRPGRVLIINLIVWKTISYRKVFHRS